MYVLDIASFVLVILAIVLTVFVAIMVRRLEKNVYDLSVAVNQVCEMVAKLMIRVGDR